jgi:hypothetical protein
VGSSLIQIQKVSGTNNDTTLLMLGNTLHLDNSNIIDYNQTSTTPGNVIVDMDSLAGPDNLNSSISILSGSGTPSSIQASTAGDGAGGVVELDANDIEITGTSAEVLSQAEPLLTYGGQPNVLSVQTNGHAPQGDAGSITLNVGETLNVNGGQISTDTFGTGNAGLITVQGAATPNTSPAVTIQNGGQITSNTVVLTSSQSSLFSTLTPDQYTTDLMNSGYQYTNTGTAGTINVTVGSLTINGSKISSSAGNPNSLPTDSTGNGGSITVTINANPGVTGANGNILIENGGQINAATNTKGNAGTVTVAGSSLTINGGNISTSAGTSNSLSTDSTGNGGNVTVTITGTSGVSGANGDITLENGGLITASSYTAGLGGTVTVDQSNSVGADSFGNQGIDLQGSGSGITATINGIGNSVAVFDPANNPYAVNVENATGLTLHGGQIASSTSSLGQAGPTHVHVAGGVDLTTGGQLTSGTIGTGDGADINFTADSLTLDGNGTSPGDLTEIFSSTAGGGKAGDVDVTISGNVDIINGGQISSGTTGAGAGGAINLSVGGTISIIGIGSEITSAASGLGNAGNITISTPDSLTVTNQATINSSSTLSNSGNIAISANQLTMQSGGDINTSASAIHPSLTAGNGGAISITVGYLVYLLDSQITTQATGNGGDISLDPEFIVLNDSLISANAALGSGGNINIIGNYFLNSGTQITATGSTDGTITISSPAVNLSGILLPLPSELTSDEKRLRESCARSINHEFSSLIVVGRGGTETDPQELRPDFGLIQAQPSPRPTVDIDELPSAPTVP